MCIYKYSLLGPFNVVHNVCLGMSIWDWVTYRRLSLEETRLSQCLSLVTFDLGVGALCNSSVHPSTLECQLVFSLYGSCLGGSVVKIPWVQFPLYRRYYLVSRHLGPLALKIFPLPFVMFLEP